jgi:superfamily II DNA or RNA helicase
MLKHSCKIRILDEINCIIVGLTPDHIAYFFEEYGIFVANYFFNPKYNLGMWDGKIRYFFKTGKTYVNLLDEIIPRLIGLGYTISIEDNRVSTPICPTHITEDFFSNIPDPDYPENQWKMRPYQIELVNALIDNGGGIALAGTGSGKTSCCAAIALSYERTGNLRSIIIVPDKNLTEQTIREYEFFGLDVGQYSGERKDVHHAHVVSTWQALQNNPTIIQDFNVVIVDEAHGIRGQSLTKILNEYGKEISYRFGVTGTMPKAKTDEMAVKISIGKTCYSIPAHTLIDQGYLAKLHIDIFQLTEDFHVQYDEYLEDMKHVPDGICVTYNKFKDSYFPDFTAEKRYLRTEQDRLQWIVDYIEVKRNMGKGNVFCLIDGIQFGKKLTKLVEDAVFVYGKDKMKDRREIYDLFKTNNNLVVIANVQVASTGLDIKRIFNMMAIDVGKSFVRIIQTIGRGLRKAPDKDFVHFTDICSDLKYGKKHLKERTKFYKEANYPFIKHKVDYHK